MDSSWHVDARIYEEDLSSIKEGQEAEVDLLFKTPLHMKAKIQGIGSWDPKSRTTRVRVNLEKALNQTSLGKEVHLVIMIHLGGALSVPKAAVFDTGNRQIVFIAHSDGNFEPREIKVGARSEEFYEVKSGLSAGDLVVTSGNFLIDSESRLKGSLQSIANK